VGACAIAATSGSAPGGLNPNPQANDNRRKTSVSGNRKITPNSLSAAKSTRQFKAKADFRHARIDAHRRKGNFDAGSTLGSVQKRNSATVSARNAVVNTMAT